MTGVLPSTARPVRRRRGAGTGGPAAACAGRTGRGSAAADGLRPTNRRFARRKPPAGPRWNTRRGGRAEMEQREAALRQRERELAEQRRILAEEYRLLRVQRAAAVSAPVECPRPGTPVSAVRQPSFTTSRPGFWAWLKRVATARRGPWKATSRFVEEYGDVSARSVVAGENRIASRPHRCGRPRLCRSAAGRGARQGRIPHHRHRPGPTEGRRRSRDGRSYIPDVATADVQALRERGQARRDDRFLRRGRARHHQHLRADAAAQDQGPGHVLHRVGGRGDRQAPAPGHADGPRVHHVSGHDRRSRAAAARGHRAQGRRRLLPRVLPRAGRPGQPDLPDPQRPEGGRRPDRRLCTRLAAALYGTRSRRSCRSARPGSPRW